MARDAGAMRQHVAECDCVVKRAVIKLDSGHRLANGPVPGEFSFLDQKSGRHRGKQFGVRGDRIQSVRRDRQLLLIVAIAVALREHQLVAHDNADADARRVPIFQRFLHERVKASQLLGHLGGFVLCVGA